MKSGKTKTFSPSDLPVDVREAVLSWELKTSAQAIVEPALPPAIKSPVDTSQLTTKQRNVMCARLAFVREIERLTASGMAKGIIMDNLVDASRKGALAPQLLPLVVVANDRSSGERGLSRRSLQRWCSLFAQGGEGALAPARNSKDMDVPTWAGDFLAVYQRPSNPTLTDAYRQVFGLPHRPNPGAPSIHAVRRFVSKLSMPARLQGRKTGNAWVVRPAP
jgi:putative transposase